MPLDAHAQNCVAKVTWLTNVCDDPNVRDSGGAKGGMRKIECLAQVGWWLVVNE